MKYKIGFTQGTFDTLHYGHINLLKKTKEYVDFLIVGVNSDELVSDYKSKIPIIQTIERAKIVESIKYVDKVIVCDTLDKIKVLEQLKEKVEVIFIGDDWKGTDRWNKTEKELKLINVDVIYIPYTKGISSSLIRKKINND